MAKEEVPFIQKKFLDIVSKKEDVIDLENRNVTKGGKEIILLTNGTKILDPKGNLIGYRGVDKDITGKKNSENEMNKFNTLAIDRELKMIELKKEINALQRELGRKPRYVER